MVGRIIRWSLTCRRIITSPWVQARLNLQIVAKVMKPFLFPWGLFQVLPGGGVGVRTQASKLIPRVLATSTTAHPTPEQERLKSKSICEVQHSLIHPHTTVWQAFHILYQYTKVLTSALILVIRFLCPNWSTVSARWGQNRRREEARI